MAQKNKTIYYLYYNFERDIDELVKQGKLSLEVANLILKKAYKLAEDSYNAGYEDCYDEIEDDEEDW